MTGCTITFCPFGPSPQNAVVEAGGDHINCLILTTHGEMPESFLVLWDSECFNSSQFASDSILNHFTIKKLMPGVDVLEIHCFKVVHHPEKGGPATWRCEEKTYGKLMHGGPSDTGNPRRGGKFPTARTH